MERWFKIQKRSYCTGSDGFLLRETSLGLSSDRLKSAGEETAGLRKMDAQGSNRKD